MSSEAIGAIAERYSTALYELAEQASALDSVAGDLKSLKAIIAESDQLRRLLHSPVVSRSEQRQALVALAVQAGFGDLTRNFLGLLAQNRRAGSLGGIIAAYLNRLAAKRGEVTAQVVSAVPLTETQVGSLGASLKKIVGGNVALDLAVDPSLLGGLVVKVGSRMVDGSLKTKLQHLQLAMKGVG